mmetsp:Transcript_31458/g.36283  ORF Transcript_31458/g.36283 Transcript_31458/m.36283 type:complete len:109 (-) Transcript_31458:347-673(-)
MGGSVVDSNVAECGGEKMWGPRLARKVVVRDTGGYWELGKLRPNILDEILPNWTRIVDAIQMVFQENESYLCIDDDEIRSAGKRLHVIWPRRFAGEHTDISGRYEENR